MAPTLTALAGFDGHQGVALVAKPRPAGDVDAILAGARERNEAPFVLVLDLARGPAELRHADADGKKAPGAHGAAPIPRVGRRRSARPQSRPRPGATEHLVLAAVDDLA